MMQVTEELMRRARDAALQVQERGTSAGVDDMEGYFVAAEGSSIPSSAKRIVSFGFGGKKYILFAIADLN